MTTYSKAQERYWKLAYKCGVSQGKPLAHWWWELQYRWFWRWHRGETFRVFRPEDIMRALDPTIKPWNL